MPTAIMLTAGTWSESEHTSKDTHRWQCYSRVVTFYWHKTKKRIEENMRVQKQSWNLNIIYLLVKKEDTTILVMKKYIGENVNNNICNSFIFISLAIFFCKRVHLLMGKCGLTLCLTLCGFSAENRCFHVFFLQNKTSWIVILLLNRVRPP